MSELGARGRGHEVDLRGQVVVLRRVHGNWKRLNGGRARIDQNREERAASGSDSFRW
jgi:hypothetical protein